METLLRHLREHQESITTSYEMDTQETSRASEGILMRPTMRKYVSVFRIDGEPIIPPLMTSEKIRQMQKLKEKALKVEQRLKERRLRLNKENDSNEEGLCETTRSSVMNTATDSISHRSQDYYDAKLKESEESMMILQDIIRRQSGGDEANLTYTKAIDCSPRRSDDKLRKLQKSETLIYDNSTNEVIKQIQTDDQREKLRELANLNHHHQLKKPSHLMLAGLNEHAMSIPSICINPPTPLVANRQICEPLSARESQDDSFFVTETQHIPQHLADDVSSDESFNSMFTHSDDRPPPVPIRHNVGIPRSGKMHDLKAYNNATNVTAKIQQFEAISSDHSSPRTTPNSSPDKSGRGGILKLAPLVTAMSRSATSPSIKLSACGATPQNTPDCSHDSADNPLIRSSSFTLEAPSKALIDHMRQQRSISDRPRSNTAAGIKAPTTPTSSTLNITRKISPTSRVHRDTIESKAKRVQKVELKPSRQKSHQKSSQQKLAQAAAASMSPYKSNSSAFPTHGSTSNLYKTKKSPYDTKTSPSLTSNPSVRTSSSSQSVRKSPTSSVSSVPSQRTAKSKSSRSNVHTNPTGGQKATTPEKEALSQMDRTQKGKFLRLLKQQEEEQRKLKQAFEMQQKLLIEQLNKEMAGTQIKSAAATPAQSSRASSAAENVNFQLSGFSPDSTYQHPASQQYSQQSPTTSNDSSLVSSVATLTQNTTATDYSQVPSLTISNLSSMDHSNANTSLDGSSSMRERVCDQSTHRADHQTLPPNANATPVENGPNVVSAGANSASRRRLFPQEHMMTSSAASPIEASMRPLNSRRLSDSQTTNSKQGYMGWANNANSRRPIDINVAHAAATTINAYARGFLVRRLFQTEQIQRIVQTIHDTLVFVLNLHIETCTNPNEGNSPTNIKLKARLLQQLSSASHTLHLVLFQTSVKERMEIIARDRKRIKTKLMAMNRKSTSKRTPRIAG